MKSAGKDIKAEADFLFKHPFDVNQPLGRAEIIDKSNLRQSMERQVNKFNEGHTWAQVNSDTETSLLNLVNSDISMDNKTNDVTDNVSLSTEMVPITGSRKMERGQYTYDGKVMSTRLWAGPL